MGWEKLGKLVGSGGNADIRSRLHLVGAQPDRLFRSRPGQCALAYPVWPILTLLQQAGKQAVVRKGSVRPRISRANPFDGDRAPLAVVHIDDRGSTTRDCHLANPLIGRGEVSPTEGQNQFGSLSQSEVYELQAREYTLHGLVGRMNTRHVLFYIANARAVIEGLCFLLG